MEIVELDIDNIICDIQGRTNQEVAGLYNNLLEFGQVEPLLVEGPDERGRYYLIHGYLRYIAMKKNRNVFKKLKCEVVRGVTSIEERNILRLLIVSSNKKLTGLDQQLIYEEINDDTIMNKILSKSKQQRMKKGINVPKDVRVKYEKKRRSQDALSVIYDLDDLDDYRKLLLKRLYDGEITTDHGGAIKKVIKDPLYRCLEVEQKTAAIEKAINSAVLTKNQAGFIITEQIMKNNPQSINMDSWVEYLCEEIANITDLIHEDLKGIVTNKQKIKLKETINLLNNKLGFEEKRNNWEDINSSPNKFESKDVPFNHVKKGEHTIVFHKRDGNKLIFRFT